MKRIIMMIMVFMLLVGCSVSTLKEDPYIKEERKIQNLSGREAFVWIPESWNVVKENDRLYFLDGVPETTRTSDPLIKSQLLYRLSYEDM